MTFPPVLFSSETGEHGTPQDLYDQLDKEHQFTLDVCATPYNRKAFLFFTKAQDSLHQEWAPHSCFMNPPYGRGVGAWIEKARTEAGKGALVVCLLPARTDTTWFHSWIWDSENHRPLPGVEVQFLRGRLRFTGDRNEGPAPFPSMIVIFRRFLLAN